VHENKLEDHVRPQMFPADYYASLIAGLVHKVNNIMTVLSGHSGLLLMESDLRKDVSQQIEQIAKATQMLSRYVYEAAMATKATPLNCELVRVSEMLESADVFSDGLVTKPFDTTLCVWGELQKIKKIVSQIVLNAIQAGAKIVHLSVKQDGNFVLFRFRDNGPGINSQMISRIFDPFFTTNKRDDNFGLGLFKAKGELARMNGRISAKSNGKTYTEIRIWIPRG
jgi:signal transduction histidine kinase